MNEADKVTAELMALAEAYAQCGTRNHKHYRAALEQAIRRAVDWGEPVAWRWSYGTSEILASGHDSRWRYSDTYLQPFSDRVIQPLYARNKP